MSTAQQQRERVNRRRSIGGVLGIVVLLVVVGFVLARAAVPPAADVRAEAAGASEYGVTMGSADAPHTIVVYEDFLCPFCGELERESHDRLVALAAQGRVLVDYRPFHYLDPDYSAQAANAFKVVLDAAGPEVALAFHTELYADQPEESGPFPEADELVEKAVAAGAADDDVRAGIEGETQADWVEAASEAARDTGLAGTPTVLLDGEAFTEGSTVTELADNLVAAVS